MRSVDEKKIEINKLFKERDDLQAHKSELKKADLQKFRVGCHTVDPRLVKYGEVRDAVLRDGFIYVGSQEFYFQEDQSVVDAFFNKDVEHTLVLWLGSLHFYHPISKKTPTSKVAR